MFAHSLQRSIRCARASPVISSACRRRFSATPLSCAPENSKNEADDSFDLFDGLRSDHASSSATSKLPGNAKEIEDEDDDAFASPESFGVPGRRSNRATSVKENPFSMLSDADRTDETYERLAAAQPARWSGRNLRAFATPSNEPPRMMRGVHRPRERALGNTPAESANFHAAIRKIFDDLSRTSGSSSTSMSAPSSDPYASQFGLGLGARSGRGALGMQHALGGAGYGPGYGYGYGQGGRGNAAMDQDTLMRFDELKDEIGLLGTDMEVLEWAREQVFRKEEGKDGVEEYPAVYPHILALTLRTLRTNFDNPHLALALFNHAQTLSLESYMSGCLTGAYNEVIIIRWDCFRDLEGVEQAIREMDVIGVVWDKTTRKTVQGVCEEVGRNLRKSANGVDEIAKVIEARWQTLEKRLQADMRREVVIDSAKRKDSAIKAKRGDRVTLRNKRRGPEAGSTVDAEQSNLGPGGRARERPPIETYGL